MLVSNVFAGKKVFDLFNSPAIGKQKVDHGLLFRVTEVILVDVFFNSHKPKLTIDDYDGKKRSSCINEQIFKLSPHLNAFRAIGADIDILAAL